MFKNRKWIGMVLITLLVIGVLATGGWSIYRLGFNHGMIKAQSDVMPGAMRLGMHGFGKKDMGPGQEGFKFQHLFKNRGGEEHKGMFPGRGGNGIHDGNTSPFRGNYSSHWGRGSGILQLLFAVTLVGLFVYVVVKVFQPGGWQLSFGPLHKGNLDDKETSKSDVKLGKAKKASVKKGK